MKALIKTLLVASSITCAFSCNSIKDGEYTLEVLTTNDVHGSWFDEPYVDGAVKNSLYAVNHYADSIRTAAGAENVIFIDAGDCLQGDNAAYYFNYVDTETPHLYPRMAQYMKYDVVTVGNHDIETGHDVYDRITKQLKSYGIPFLGGNAIRNDNGKPYFQVYETFNKAGLKVVVLGFTNPNIKAWLTESLWSGMTFADLLPLVQKDVDEVIAKEKPQVVIVSVHSGTGSGDGSVLESQGLDLLNSLKGVDFLICSHDHRATCIQNGDTWLINSGSHSRNLGHGTIKVTVKDGKVVSKELSAGLIPIKAKNVDTEMKAYFQKDYDAVKAFTVREVGELKTDLITREAYTGMNNYVNLVHTIQLGCTPAELSFAAPLTANGVIKAGTLIYNDLFTIYPYENQLFVVKFKGSEIKDYLEYSYDSWINTISSANDHILKIQKRPDTRNGQESWSFIGASFNFDSAAGLNYTVDVTKPYGERINIESLADGTPFDMNREYNVAMTSYRASGGGGLVDNGAKVDSDSIDERVVERYPEIREILYDYIQKNGSIDPEKISDPKVIGHWEFIPESIAKPAMETDMSLMFKR